MTTFGIKTGKRHAPLLRHIDLGLLLRSASISGSLAKVGGQQCSGQLDMSSSVHPVKKPLNSIAKHETVIDFMSPACLSVLLMSIYRMLVYRAWATESK